MAHGPSLQAASAAPAPRPGDRTPGADRRGRARVRDATTRRRRAQAHRRRGRHEPRPDHSLLRHLPQPRRGDAAAPGPRGTRPRARAHRRCRGAGAGRRAARDPVRGARRPGAPAVAALAARGRARRRHRARPAGPRAPSRRRPHRDDAGAAADRRTSCCGSSKHCSRWSRRRSAGRSASTCLPARWGGPPRPSSTRRSATRWQRWRSCFSAATYRRPDDFREGSASSGHYRETAMQEPMMIRKTWLCALALVAGCGGTVATLVLLGTVASTGDAIAVRAVDGTTVVTATPLGSDGTFALEIPAGSYHLEMLTSTGVRPVVTAKSGRARRPRVPRLQAGRAVEHRQRRRSGRRRQRPRRRQWPRRHGRGRWPGGPGGGSDACDLQRPRRQQLSAASAASGLRPERARREQLSAATARRLATTVQRWLGAE